jgi:hypothetical protein
MVLWLENNEICSLFTNLIFISFIYDGSVDLVINFQLSCEESHARF